MSKNTKNTFVISLISAILSLGFCLYFIFEIKSQGSRLAEQVAIIAEYNSKELSYLNIKKIMTETENEREQISSKFFKNDNDSISFLSDIEILAPKMGLVLKTESLDAVTDATKKLNFVKITFLYSGQKNAVMDFSKMMENIPYNSSVESLSLKEISDGSWEGKTTILILIQPS